MHTLGGRLEPIPRNCNIENIALVKTIQLLHNNKKITTKLCGYRTTVFKNERFTTKNDLFTFS